MDHQSKFAVQKIVVLLHSTHEILENILDRASEEKSERISVRSTVDPKDGLGFLELEAHSIHDLAKEVEIKLSESMDKERKVRCRMESMVSSLKKENHDIRGMLEVAISEKEEAENSLYVLKGDADQRRSSILQIAEKGLQKVGFGFIMDVISGESEGDDMSSSSAGAASDGRESKQEVDSLVNSSTSLRCSCHSSVVQIIIQYNMKLLVVKQLSCKLYCMIFHAMHLETISHVMLISCQLKSLPIEKLLC